MILAGGDPAAFAALVRILDRGGVAIAPGDTMYGLIGAVPDSEARLRSVKGRGEVKPFLQLLAEPSWVSRISDVPLPPRLSRFWPGPLTIVFPARAGGTVALRVPDSPFLRDLLRALGRPLYSTSVNRAGSSPLGTLMEMQQAFEADVDAIFNGGEQVPGAPSTLLDISTRPFSILRQGAVRLQPDDLL